MVMHPSSQRNTPTSRWLTYGLPLWKLHQSIVCPESTVSKASLDMRWWIISSSKSNSCPYYGGSRLPCVISPFVKRTFIVLAKMIPKHLSFERYPAKTKRTSRHSRLLEPSSSFLLFYRSSSVLRAVSYHSSQI